MNKQFDSQNKLSEIWKKMREIVDRSANSDYIYRGEPECYHKVSSSLYRQTRSDNTTDASDFDIDLIEKEMLREAKQHTNQTDDFEILSILQQYGSETNQIDFTTDYLIALFFACNGAFNEDGRVILQKRELIKHYIVQPREPRNRIIAQKSIFVRPRDGFFIPKPEDIITIPAALKQPILAYLQKYHTISVETIYNDLYGFIQKKSYPSAVTKKKIHTTKTRVYSYTQFSLPEGAKARFGKGNINEIKYSPDGTRIAVTTDIGIWVYDADSGKELFLLTEHARKVMSIAFSPDGQTFATGSWKEIRLWDALTGAPQQTLTGHTHYVESITFSPDGKVLASGGSFQDYSVRLWNVKTGEHKRTLTGHQHTVTSLAFSPNGQTLASSLSQLV